MNKEKIKLDALANKDHQIVLAIIYWLENCHTQEALNLIVETALIPLVNCSGVFYVKFENNDKSPQLLGSIRPSHLCQSRWNDFLVAAIRTHAAANYAAVLYTHNQNGMSHYQINDHDTMTVLFDAPKRSVAVCLCHMNSDKPHFNQRHIELLKLLRPSLLQSIILLMNENLD